jgi:Heterokaryon incompatibility protein (HET)
MHLLNAETIRLEPRTDQIESYAILSHRWEKEEVLFEQISGARGGTEQLEGFKKVREACAQACRDGYSHIWIDTCCVDQRSSSELSEAINSMFAWYREAAVCYAYLSDVEGDLNPQFDPQFAKSEWFERGWTLQELIAPANVIFFSRTWRELGRKTTIRPRLSIITGIDEEVLAMTQSLESVSIAKRMSWAAKRKTTRMRTEHIL